MLFPALICASFLALGNALLIPHPWQAALMARYVVHEADWIAISTKSTQKETTGYPFVNLQSMSDGPVTNSTGIPYLYMSDLDLSAIDIHSDNRVTIMASLAELDYCKSKNYDPEDPRCAKIFLTGKYVKVNSTSEEYKFAENALFSRHPAMESWPKDHHFFVAKIEIEHVGVIDYFGGVKHVSVNDYFAAKEYFEKFSFANVEVVEVTV